MKERLVCGEEGRGLMCWEQSFREQWPLADEKTIKRNEVTTTAVN